MFSLQVIKWFINKWNLNISLFELITKNAKECCITFLLVASQETNLNLKRTTISLSIIYIFWHLAQVHNTCKCKPHNLLRATTICHMSLHIQLKFQICVSNWNLIIHQLHGHLVAWYGLRWQKKIILQVKRVWDLLWRIYIYKSLTNW